MMDYPQSARVIQFPTMPKLNTKPATNRLRQYRQERKIRQSVVADAIGTSTVQVSRLEIGARDLDLYWMHRCAKFYGVPPADLLLLEDGGLTGQERQLIDTIRDIPAPLRETFWRLMDSHQPLRGMGDVADMPKTG